MFYSKLLKSTVYKGKFFLYSCKLHNSFHLPIRIKTLKVLVVTIDALGHFETG